MLIRPKKSSKSKAIDRAFTSAIWSKAQKIASQCQVILHRDAGHWYGRALEMPHVCADGATPAKCVEATTEALATAIGYLLEEGQRPPMPASSGMRTQQVNVWLTADEKILFETIAKRKGFQGLSDFMCAAAMESAH